MKSMREIGRITVEDHLTPIVAAFNAMLPSRDALRLVSDQDVSRVERGVGPGGPFIRIMPTPHLLLQMAYALQERACLVDQGA